MAASNCHPELIERCTGENSAKQSLVTAGETAHRDMV